MASSRPRLSSSASYSSAFPAALSTLDRAYEWSNEGLVCPGVGSVTQLAAKAAPEDTPVVGAFHNLAAGRLANLDADLDWDTVVVGDERDAKDTVIELAEAIEGLRALDGGPLANAAEVEAVTPLLINVARHNDGMHDLGVQFR